MMQNVLLTTKLYYIDNIFENYITEADFLDI